MANTIEHQPEEVFEGKALSIHIAPEGIALSRRGQVPGPLPENVAEYSEVEGVGVHGRSKPSLIVDFGDSRPAWVIPKMRRSHAEWARRSIEKHALRIRQHQQPLFSSRLPIADVAAQTRQLLQRSPVDIPGVAQALLAQAVFHRASDLHVAPGGKQTVVRWRLNGLLQDVLTVEPSVGKRLVARMKVVAGLATYQHDTIQEGHVSLELASTVEFRFTVMPTLHGENLTVRIFDPSLGILPLDTLGMLEPDLSAYKRIIDQPSGMVVLTGPAGSGKTTTMYSSMQHLSLQDGGVLSFATVEQPVEYDLAFASQTTVTDRPDMTFAKALRTVLRQDPNVIMVGEIRDPETAEIAVRAGMTGHLIFTTLHTATAGEVFPRLAEMDVPPFLSTSAVRCILSQRLVRTLCDCARPAEPAPELLSAAGLSGQDVTGWQFKAAEGCEKCDGSGYSGRTAIVQVTPVGAELRELALANAPAQEFEAKIAQAGAPSLHELAYEKVKLGIIPLEEVARVLGEPR